MTTIATDGKSMAADSRGCANNIVRNDSEVKLHRISGGRITGCSGTIGAAKAYIAWLDKNDGSAKPKVDDGFRALVLHPEGRIEVHCNDEMPDIAQAPAVLGSGGSLALGAMLAGASPAEAVEIAAMRDPFTGGTITELSIEDPR